MDVGRRCGRQMGGIVFAFTYFYAANRTVVTHTVGAERFSFYRSRQLHRLVMLGSSGGG